MKNKIILGTLMGIAFYICIMVESLVAVILTAIVFGLICGEVLIRGMK